MNIEHSALAAGIGALTLRKKIKNINEQDEQLIKKAAEMKAKGGLANLKYNLTGGLGSKAAINKTLHGRVALRKAIEAAKQKKAGIPGDKIGPDDGKQIATRIEDVAPKTVGQAARYGYLAKLRR